MSNTKLDPRKGGTSASNAQADLLCPGRHLAQAGLPEPPISADAEHGRIIHQALAASGPDQTEILNRLTLEQRKVFDDCRELEKQTVHRFFPEQSNDKMTVLREQRFWSRVNDSYFHSGQPDVVYLKGSKALILEYKTLTGEVPESPRNLQLRDQAVLVYGVCSITQGKNLTEVGVAIIQPLVTREVEICIYTPEDIYRAEQEMEARVVRSNTPNMRRVPGELQCRFCRANATCLEYQLWVGNILPDKPEQTAPLFRKPFPEWTPAERTKFCEALPALRQAFKWVEDVKSLIKELLKQNPDAVPGFTLVPGAVRDRFADVHGLFNRWQEWGGDPESFCLAMNPAKDRLKDELKNLLARKGQMLSGKGLDDKLVELISDFVEKYQTEPQIAKLKEIKPKNEPNGITETQDSGAAGADQKTDTHGRRPGRPRKAPAGTGV